MRQNWKRTWGALLALALCLSLLGGCEARGSGVPPKTDIPFEEGQLYAVAWLGYQKIENLEMFARKYLETMDLPVLYLSRGDYYLVIPRYDHTGISVSVADIETGENRLLYENRNSGPFILQCNESDIFADAVIRVTHEEETVEFSPFISLENGQLDVGEYGLVLTEDPAPEPAASS